MTVDGEEGLRLGSKVSRWYLVGEPGVLGFPAEPSRGVVGPSAKHSKRKEPT